MVLSVGLVALLRRVRLPPILGYLCVGMLAGPHALDWLYETETTHFLGEIGVVFLLFTVGLEFSIPQFIAMRKAVLGLGGAQVTLSTALGTLLSWTAGIPLAGAIVAGGALALSSTAIVVKQLTEQLELQSRHGQLALGILLFQDLAVAPFLVIIPILADGEQSLAWPLLLALFKGIIAFLGLFALGHWALRPLFREVAGAHSAELFTLTVLLVTLAAAWITHLLGLSLALGAFLAGMMLGETEFRHQVEADIRPFRDILLGLFFVTVGMQLDFSAFQDHWSWILLLIAGLVFGKGALISALTWFSGHESGVALRTGLVLAQGGEFGFVLLTLATSYGLFAGGTPQGVLAATTVTMALAPVLIRYNGPISKATLAGSYIRGRHQREQEIARATGELEQHTVIAGFGRIGQNIAGFLRYEGFPYVALDLDPYRVQEAHRAGDNVFFGDATHWSILRAAGIQRARALVISFDNPNAALKILHTVRQAGENIPILVRIRDDTNLERLVDAGATEVVPETVEASITLGNHLLNLLGTPADEIGQLLENVRSKRYRQLRSFFHGIEPQSLEETLGLTSHLHTITLPDNAYAVGRRLQEMDLESHGLTVAALHRNGIREDSPSPELELKAGDVLVLEGGAQSLEWGEKRLLSS